MAARAYGLVTKTERHEDAKKTLWAEFRLEYRPLYGLTALHDELNGHDEHDENPVNVRCVDGLAPRAFGPWRRE